MGTIMVGFDGSEGSLHALRWALEEASAHQDSVRVIHALPMPAGSPDFARAAVPELYRGSTPDDEAVEAAKANAQKLFETSLESVNAPDDVAVDFESVAEQPPEALIDRSDDARLLVVGSRGLGGFRSLLLGSVSQQVVHHARCPVVVIPKDR